MSNPLVHAERSAKRWGGVPGDYIEIHKWFDQTKGHLADNRHRLLLHNSLGIILAEQVFGDAVYLENGKRVFVRDIAVQHIEEDLGFVPCVAECLDEVPIRPWMAGAHAAKRSRQESDHGRSISHSRNDHGKAPGQDSAGSGQHSSLPGSDVPGQAAADPEHGPDQTHGRTKSHTQCF